MFYRSNSNRVLPRVHEMRYECVVYSKGVIHLEVVIFWVVHALLGVHVAEEDVVQPLDRDGRHFPIVGLVVFGSRSA